MKKAAIFFVFGMFLSAGAYAFRMCPPDPCAEAISRNTIVFFGKAVETNPTTDEMRADYEKARGPSGNAWDKLPDTYSDFEVQILYKGAPVEKVRVYYNSGNIASNGPLGRNVIPPSFPNGSGELVFAADRHGFLFPSEPSCGSCTVDSPKLKELKAIYDAIDDLIAKYPTAAEFYKKKAALMQANGDFLGADSVLKKMHENIKESVADPDEILAEAKNLYRAEKYDDALKMLDPLKNDKMALPYYQMSLIHLGRSAELDGQKLNLAGQELSGVTIQNADLSGSDFSGAKLSGVKVEKVKFEGANFSKAQLNVEITSGDFGEAKFDSAKISGRFMDSHFDKASFTGVEMDLRQASGNSFKAADFTSGKIYIAECTMAQKDWAGNDFSGASFRDATFGGLHKSNLSGADLSGMNFFTNRCSSQNQGVDLSGRTLDGLRFDFGDYSGASFKGASLKNTSFSGANLTGVDFSGADLSGAAFTIASYSGQVKLQGADFTGAKLEGAKWDGAIYDCKTKFPASFDPVASHLEPSDRSCVSSKPVGIGDYTRERLVQGYINVCDGNYSADCIYGFLLATTFNNMGRNSFGATISHVAKSFLDAGEPELARLMTMRMLAQMPQLEHQYFLGHNKDALLMLAKVYHALKDTKMEAEMLQLGQMANQRLYINDHPAFQPDYERDLLDEWIASGDIIGAEMAFDEYYQNNPYLIYGGYAPDGMRMLEHLSLAYARAGEFDKAISLAKKLGSKQELGGTLAGQIRQDTSPGSFETSYKRAYQDARVRTTFHIDSDQYLAAISQVALVRYAKGERDFLKEYLAQADKLTQKIPEDYPPQLYVGQPPQAPQPVVRDHRRAAVLEILSGVPIEEISKGLQGNAGYIMYLPGVGDALAATGNVEPIWNAVMQPIEQPEGKVALFQSLVEYYATHPDKEGMERFRKGLRTIAVDRLPIRSDLIIVGGEFRVHKAIFDNLVKIKSIDGIEEIMKAAEGYGSPALKAYVALYAAAAAAELNDDKKAWKWFGQFRTVYEEQLKEQKGQRYFIPADEDIADFVLAIAASKAPPESKQKALEAAKALLGTPPGTSLIPLKIALARKMAGAEGYTDAELETALVSPLLGDPNVLVAAIAFLREKGFHHEARLLLPKAVTRVEYADERFIGKSLSQLAGILAAEGDIAGAETMARTTFDRASKGSSSENAGDLNPWALKEVAIVAAESDKTDIAVAIIKDYLSNDAEARSDVYFSLAQAALVKNDKASAEKFYGLGHDAVPDLFSMAKGSESDPQADSLVKRALAERALGKTDAFRQTSDFLRAMLPVMERQRDKAAEAQLVAQALKKLTAQSKVVDSVELAPIKEKFPHPDFNATTQLRDIALSLIEEGKKDKAREVALWGLQGVGNFPASDAKAELLISYADIIALSGTPLTEDSRHQLEKIIRTTPFARYGQQQPGEVPPKEGDYVAQGEVILHQLEEEKSNPPPIDGARVRRH